MNLRDTILAGNSKAQNEKTIRWIGDSQERFDELFQLFLNDEYRVVQRVAAPLSCCVARHPQMMKNNFKKFVSNLRKPGLPNAVKRNSMRLLQSIEIPARYQGEIMNLCFSYIASPTEAVAIKALSLTVLENLSRLHPEIVPEIKLIIEDRWPHETAACHVRAKKFLNYYGGAISNKKLVWISI